MPYSVVNCRPPGRCNIRLEVGSSEAMERRSTCRVVQVIIEPHGRAGFSSTKATPSLIFFAPTAGRTPCSHADATPAAAPVCSPPQNSGSPSGGAGTASAVTERALSAPLRGHLPPVFHRNRLIRVGAHLRVRPARDGRRADTQVGPYPLKQDTSVPGSFLIPASSPDRKGRRLRYAPDAKQGAQPCALLELYSVFQPKKERIWP